jgi:NIMA (never in mitosis gene a)-related kinase
MARKEELKRFEESLLARSASLDERQRAIEARDASLQARESIVVNREEEAKETQKRLNFAAETLRGQWDKLREEKERDRLGMGLPKPDERGELSRQMMERGLAD